MKTTVQEDMFADVHISKLKRAKSIVNTVTSPLCSSTVTAASASWFINSLFCLFNAHTVTARGGMEKVVDQTSTKSCIRPPVYEFGLPNQTRPQISLEINKSPRNQSNVLTRR